MKIAEETRMRILVKKSTMILSAIEIALEDSIDYDEHAGGEHDLTFVFTYSDDSQLRIDTRGDVYDDSNPEVNNLYRISGNW